MSDDAEKPVEEKPGDPVAAPPLPAGFDPKKTHVVHQWKYTSPLINCRFEPKGRYVFSCAEDNAVQRWEFPSGKLTKLEGHESWPRDIAFLPDGETVITVGSDERMLFWSTVEEDPKPIRTIKAHQGWVRCLNVSPDGALIATGGNDNLVKLWNADDGALVRELAGHESNVYSVMFHPGGQLLLSGDLSGQVREWDVGTGQQVHQFDGKDLHTYNGGQQVHYGGVRSLALSPDEKTLACCGLYKATNPLGAVNEPLVVAFEYATQKKTRSHITDGVKGIAWRVIYLADGTLVTASGGAGGGFLLFWKTDQDKSYHKFKMPDTARGLDQHSDQLHLATVHFDRHLRISRMTAKV
ncbi:MAG: WD40 repeat domain-containing protein [Pirellulales bacterium]